MLRLLAAVCVMVHRREVETACCAGFGRIMVVSLIRSCGSCRWVENMAPALWSAKTIFIPDRRQVNDADSRIPTDLARIRGTVPWKSAASRIPNTLTALAIELDSLPLCVRIWGFYTSWRSFRAARAALCKCCKRHVPMCDILCLTSQVV